MECHKTLLRWPEGKRDGKLFRPPAAFFSSTRGGSVKIIDPTPDAEVAVP
jgi:hypothetical protein